MFLRGGMPLWKWISVCFAALFAIYVWSTDGSDDGSSKASSQASSGSTAGSETAGEEQART